METRLKDAAPIAPPIVRQAALWMARMWSGSASAAEQEACRQWRAGHPDHERAWQRLSALEGRLDSLPAQAAHGVLVKPEMAALRTRRRALRLLGLTAGLGVAAFATSRTDTWQGLVADAATANGEQREMILADGTRVLLDTQTALDIDFSGTERLLVLRAGRILVTTSHAPAYAAQPFLVRSADGTVQALGTHFSVRQDDGRSHVAVYEGLVEIRPRLRHDGPVRVAAGQQSDFSSTAAQVPAQLDEASPGWTNGLLVVRNQRLADVVAEIGRYRRGLLGCDPAVADLRVSGVFSLKDTDRALSNLTLGLPLAIRYRTRYWVTVMARAS